MNNIREWAQTHRVASLAIAVGTIVLIGVLITRPWTWGNDDETSATSERPSATVEVDPGSSDTGESTDTTDSADSDSTDTSSSSSSSSSSSASSSSDTTDASIARQQEIRDNHGADLKPARLELAKRVVQQYVAVGADETYEQRSAAMSSLVREYDETATSQVGRTIMGRGWTTDAVITFTATDASLCDTSTYDGVVAANICVTGDWEAQITEGTETHREYGSGTWIVLVDYDHDSDQAFKIIDPASTELEWHRG